MFGFSRPVTGLTVTGRTVARGGENGKVWIGSYRPGAALHERLRPLHHRTSQHLGQQGRFSYPLLMMQSTFHNSSKGISGQRRFASALDRAGVAQ